MTPAISVRNVGKAYRRYPTRIDKVAHFASFGRIGREALTWVLRSVSFDIAAGETVGIVGRNGAGKSTLLKIMAGTTQATEGSIAVHGRVAALLELGMGFHPDLTGRQNVSMAGNLMGLSKAELSALMPAIEAFAEIGDYLEQPLRVYSSGMQVRLAFSVATAMRPDVLIVDEALAVGDIAFQQKCFDRIGEFSASGTTIVFVTHDLSSVYRLCTRALYLDHGSLILDATPKPVIDLYQATILASTQRDAAGLRVTVRPARPMEYGTAAIRDAGRAADSTLRDPPVQDDAAQPRPLETGSYASPGVDIHSLRLLDEREAESTVFASSERMAIEVVVHFAIALPDPHVGFQIRDRRGEAIFMTTTHGLGTSIGPVAAGERHAIRFELKPMITPAQYTVTVGVANGARSDGTFERSFVRHQDAAAFWVVDPVDATRWAGIANLNATVTLGGTVDARALADQER